MATASVSNTFLTGAIIEAADHNANFADLVDFLNNNVVHRDGSKSVTGTLTFAADVSLEGILRPLSSDLVIATGAITVDRLYHRIDTEAAAASDDLDTINSASVTGTIGLLILSPVSSARDVTLKHGTGNIRLDGAADFTMTTAASVLLLVRVEGSSLWYELARTS